MREERRQIPLPIPNASGRKGGARGVSRLTMARLRHVWESPSESSPSPTSKETL